MSKLFRDIQYFFVAFTACINHYIVDSAVPIDIVTMKITHELQPPRPAIIAMIPDKVPIITRKHDQKGQRKPSHEEYKTALIKIANINTSTYERSEKDEEEKTQERKHFEVEDKSLDNALKGFTEFNPRATNINTFKREKRDAHATKELEILKKLENVILQNPKVPLTLVLKVDSDTKNN
ncbi:hypothetical protein K1T71_009930 [Dendrolimus kikuchii]|uniref:Uncharacterized protein n=1 Tax=Dendrolimus kikuchii TaxID=765133 RepID=A0ACC1CUA1_9NEOP|nr:hypothetical protein K1T71_009930 [Dendrolimus kikuchii]